MRQILLRFMLSACLLLPACASTSVSPKPDMSNSNSLSARNLAPGECGLFVWMADTDKRFILFSQSQTNSGIWKSPADEVILKMTKKEGVPTEGQYPIQGFEGAGLTLALKDSEAITQGTRYKAGTLTQTAPEGWNRVTPVVALSACQPG